jgi:hypothetical protein
MEVPMMVRLRLLLAMFLLCLGTWVATLAIGGQRQAGMATRAGSSVPSTGSSASPDAQQFISFLTRERFVADDGAVTTAPVKSKAAKPAVRAKPAAVEKRRQQADAQLPWPLSLLSN